MSWQEFTDLLEYLPAESQLARIIAVRTAEGEELNGLSASQKRLRNDWYSWLDRQATPDEKAQGSKELQKFFKSMFYERRN